MTVLLVLAIFAIFLTIDYFYAKAKHPVLQVAPAMRKQQGVAATPRQPSLVGGFSVPDNLRYHPGHTWALSESPNLVRIGIDDFASKLTGKVESIALPQRGQWIRQGQKVWSIVRNGVKVDMVSPIEGSVSDINEAVVNDPTLATKDPYGEGWLVTVQSPDSKTNFRNLLGGAWLAGGRKSLRCGCNGLCRQLSEPWRRTVAWRSTTWPARCLTSNGPRSPASSS